MAPHFDTWPTFIGLRNWSSRACPVCVAKSTRANLLSLSFYLPLSFPPFYLFLFFLVITLIFHFYLSFSFSLSLLFSRPYPSANSIFPFLDSFPFPSRPTPFRRSFWINFFAFFLRVYNLYIAYFVIYQLQNCSFILSFSLSLSLKIFSIKFIDNLITLPFVKKFTKLVYTLLIQITFSFFKVVRHSDGGWASDSSIYIAFNTREDLWVISPFSFACWPKWRAI